VVKSGRRSTGSRASRPGRIDPQAPRRLGERSTRPGSDLGRSPVSTPQPRRAPRALDTSGMRFTSVRWTLPERRT
jgi:hypothetical protein